MFSFLIEFAMRLVLIVANSNRNNICKYLVCKSE